MSDLDALAGSQGKKVMGTLMHKNSAKWTAAGYTTNRKLELLLVKNLLFDIFDISISKQITLNFRRSCRRCLRPIVLHFCYRYLSRRLANQNLSKLAWSSRRHPYPYRKQTK